MIFIPRKSANCGDYLPAGSVTLAVSASRLKKNNILEDYKSRGYKVMGYGGVRWFRHPALSCLFDEFYFYGENDYSSVFTRRKLSEFPLAHTDDIVGKIEGNKYFIFINCPETHVPYNFSDADIPHEGRKIIDKYRDLWGGKRASFPLGDVAPSELQLLHKAQIAALEAVDGRLGLLIGKLPRPLTVVIAGDHGECFGEDLMWGHGYPHPKVMEVPLVITQLL